MTTWHSRRILLGLTLSLLAMGTGHAASITHTTAYEYHPTSGRLSKSIVEPDNVQLRLETASTYDAWGNQTTVTVSSPATGMAAIAPRVSTVTYDARGQFSTGDSNALNQSESKTTESNFGMPMSLTGPNGLTTYWGYDDFGRKILETRADNTQTIVSYNYCAGYNNGTTPCPSLARYMVQSTPYARNGGPIGAWTKVYYDAADREVRSETQGFDGSSVIAKDTQYDNLGRVYRVSIPYYAGQSPQWTTYAYDLLGRVVTETRRDNSQTITAFSGLTSVATNALTQKRTQIKNSQGNVLRVIDAQNNSITYQYDPFGNLTQTTDPLGNVTTLTYDIRGRKTGMTDRDMGTWSYTYDVLGQLVRQTDAKNQVTSIAYDKLGRMVNRAEIDLISTWTYDNCTMGIGKLCNSTADSGYASTLSYDLYGRPANTVTSMDAVYNTAIGYDGNGRIALQTYPTGFAVKYLYTPLGYLQEVRNNATDFIYWHADSKDAEGHLLQQTYGNHVITQQNYEYGRLKTAYAGAGNNAQSNVYNYDPVGNLLSRTDANQNLSETFLYDNLRRLTSSTVNSNGAGLVTQNYSYDVLGNIASRSDMGSYTYNPAGAGSVRPHAVKEIALIGGGKQQYTYDANGNMSGQTVLDAAGNVVLTKGRTEVYTSFNMPQALGAPGISLAFIYGPDHQRVKQIAPAGTTIYLHPDNSGGLLYEKDLKPNGTTEHTHYITAGDRVVAIYKQTPAGNTLRYLHQDYLGSTAAITDEAGSVVERLAYDPFGKRRTPAGVFDPNNPIAGINTDRGFTMHEHLDELGLIHMNGRIYDPSIGRFMSADAGVPHPLDMQSFNRYSYTRNNPLVYVDPDGFYDEEYDSYSQCYCVSGTTYSGSYNPYGSGYSVDYYNGGQTTTSYNQYGNGFDNQYNTNGALVSSTPSSNAYVNVGTAGAADQSYQMGRGADGTLGLIPGVGFSGDSAEAFKEGRYVTGTLYATLAAVDVVTLGSTAKVKAGGKIAGETIYVLGRQIDTAVAKDWIGHRILDIKDWTLAKNDAFINKIISEKAVVYLGSPQTKSTLWDAANNRMTVFARELQQLTAAGYKQIGDYLVPGK
jgi:RHS repeat-associated protein